MWTKFEKVNKRIKTYLSTDSLPHGSSAGPSLPSTSAANDKEPLGISFPGLEMGRTSRVTVRRCRFLSNLAYPDMLKPTSSN